MDKNTVIKKFPFLKGVLQNEKIKKYVDILIKQQNKDAELQVVELLKQEDMPKAKEYLAKNILNIHNLTSKKYREYIQLYMRYIATKNNTPGIKYSCSLTKEDIKQETGAFSDARKNLCVFHPRLFKQCKKYSIKMSPWEVHMMCISHEFGHIQDFQLSQNLPDKEFGEKWGYGSFTYFSDDTIALLKSIPVSKKDIKLFSSYALQKYAQEPKEKYARNKSLEDLTELYDEACKYTKRPNKNWNLTCLKRQIDFVKKENESYNSLSNKMNTPENIAKVKDIVRQLVDGLSNGTIKFNNIQEKNDTTGKICNKYEFIHKHLHGLTNLCQDTNLVSQEQIDSFFKFCIGNNPWDYYDDYAAVNLTLLPNNDNRNVHYMALLHTYYDTKELKPKFENFINYVKNQNKATTKCFSEEELKNITNDFLIRKEEDQQLNIKQDKINEHIK